MKKIKVGIIYGGVSSEHDISILSYNSVSKYINKEKYDVYPIYIDKKGDWYGNGQYIDNIMGYIKNMDVVFPLLHGKFGEDGTIQGLLDIIGIPYVGCGVLASSVAMDKVYTKVLLEKANIKQAQFMYIKVKDNNYILGDNEFNERAADLETINFEIEKKLGYPSFVKPARGGSSIGISKVIDENHLKKAIDNAFAYDTQIILEDCVTGREIECAILDGEVVIASCLGEIKPNDDFYSFDAKYENKANLIIPAHLSEELTDEIKKIAIKAFQTISGEGLSRIDFFVDEYTGNIVLNEINTMPGFTDISMYPKLLERCELGYSELIDRLIDLTFRYKKNKR